MDPIGFRRFYRLVDYKFGPIFQILTNRESFEEGSSDSYYIVSIKKDPDSKGSTVLFKKIGDTDWDNLGSSRILN